MIRGYLKWMKDEQGIDIGAVSLFNEPNLSVNHDSMNPPAAQAADIFASVGSYLQRHVAADGDVPMPLLVGPDGSSTGASLNYLRALLNNPDAAGFLDVAGSHYYGAAGDWGTLTGLAAPRPVWQTEWANLTNADDGIDNGLEAVTRIHQVFAGGGNAFVYFQWVVQGTDPSQGNGLIRIQPDGYVVPKRYYTFKQFANTTPAGSLRVEATSSDPNLLVTAYLWPDGHTASLQVINNTDTRPRDVTFSFTGLDGEVRHYRTSATRDDARLRDIHPTGHSFTSFVYPQTFDTFVVTCDGPSALSDRTPRPTAAGSAGGSAAGGLTSDADVASILLAPSAPAFNPSGTARASAAAGPRDALGGTDRELPVRHRPGGEQGPGHSATPGGLREVARRRLADQVLFGAWPLALAPADQGPVSPAPI
jgi:O-glycosyl hydrolase